MAERSREDLSMVDRTYHLAHQQDTKGKDLTLNMSDWQNFPWGIRKLIFSPPAYQNLYESEWHGILFENVEVSSGSVTVTVKEDANWSDGTPITGKHVRNHVLKSILMRVDTPRNELSSPNDAGAPMLLVRSPTDGGDWRRDAIQVDGKSVTFKTKEGWFGKDAPWRQSSIAREFWRANPVSPAFDKYFEQFMEMDDPFGKNYDKVEKLRGSIRSNEGLPGPTDFPTSGPFKLVETEGHKRILERHDGHPFSEYTNWKEITAEYLKGSRAQRTALMSGHLDGWSGSVPKRTLNSLPKNIEEFRYDVPRGASINFRIQDDSFENPNTFGDVRVRQALQYAIDRKFLTQAVSGETVIEASPISTPGAMGGLREYLDDSFLDTLNTYETDREKAASLLREAGFSKQSGTWNKPNGGPWSFKFQTSNSVPHFETLVVKQLNDFGIDAQLYTMDDAVYQETLEGGKHAMIKGGWGGEMEKSLSFPWWIPQNPYQRGLHGIWSDQEVQTWAEEIEKVHIDDNGYAHNFLADDLKDYFTIEAPPVGEPDGDLQEYDAAWAAMMLDWGFQFDDRSYDEVLKELAWVYNWYVPEIPIHQKKAQHFHDTKDWIVPSADAEKKWYRGSKGLINSGDISANPDS